MKRDHITIAGLSERNEAIRSVILRLEYRDYKLKFMRESNCIYNQELGMRVEPHEFTVDESYFFEELMSPDADRILYAISLVQGYKGFLVDSCHVYTDNIDRIMMQKLN